MTFDFVLRNARIAGRGPAMFDIGVVGEKIAEIAPSVATEKAIVQGTARMRTHVEVDPRIGLRSFRAICRLKRDYAWAIDLEICVFPQEGLLNDPGTEELLVAAC